MAQVHAALAYYFAHQQAIDSDLEADEVLFTEAKERGLGQRRPPLFKRS
jgi:hypothetical protein